MKINLIILFGSQISGNIRQASDFDLAVLADQPLSIKDKEKISEQIAEDLQISSDLIDLVDLSVASPLLQYSIAQTGRILSGNKDDFLRFKVLAWKRYQDTAKFRLSRKESLHTAIH